MAGHQFRFHDDDLFCDGFFFIERRQTQGNGHAFCLFGCHETAEVLKIGALARFKQTITGTASGIKVFDVTVRVNANDPRLKPGLTAELNFLIDHQTDVLFIPLSAVMAVEDKQIVRLQSETGEIIDREIVLGPSNDHIVVVKEGLAVGDRVLLNPTFSSSPP